MTDLINGLGGPVGFGDLAEFEDLFFGTQTIDITPVFEGGLTVLGETYDEIIVNDRGIARLSQSDGDGSGNDPLFRLFPSDHWLVAGPRDTTAGQTTPTPGGTSQGSGWIYSDLDPATGSVTFTFDDVASIFGDSELRNAYQIRFLDLPGGSEGAFAVEYRYEAINWGESWDFWDLPGLRLPDPRGDDYYWSINEFDLVESDDPDEIRMLTEAGVIRFEFDGEDVTSNLPGRETLTIYSDPISGTDGADVIVGTDGADLIEAGRGKDIIRPGEGIDVISGLAGANTIRGTADELLGDRIFGSIRDDRLLFEEAVFGRGDIEIGEFQGALIFDVDGNGVADGEIGMNLYDFPSRSVLTATTAQGTYVTTVVELPEPDDFFRPNNYDFDQNTRAYLRGDGQSDFALRLDGVSTLESDGTALGFYLYDRDGMISDVQLLTTNVKAAGDAEFLVEDVARGENIGVFVLTPDEAGALDDYDSFAFVDETGGEASFDDRSYIFAEVDGEIISADLIHVANKRLNIDQAQHALIGMTEREGLTIAIEDTLFGPRGDFDDIVLSIERLAVDLA
ncbi:hypothetical protein [Jannaschia seohaensis]|uniref:DUF4114 domain-containing protein n=1 Tax=Jannaschia seohaensis TaxID=475081 RepID=A0A2Y9ABA4_9RHOB|nr:hypothetical protein [Jannaschia seohaensis]PWJ21160.1 hypothetical protein BCF38_102410 [Jannaschia seohaensis]SSA41570.1 hypothetical protein SAMN05421539_102410 [Jannaschia seohaensis]